MFAVPAIAAGDVAPGGAIAHSAALAVRNFSRTWFVWLITILFSAPIGVAMCLSSTPSRRPRRRSSSAAALAAPIVWPFSALFTRALYGDLRVAPSSRPKTGRCSS